MKAKLKSLLHIERKQDLTFPEELMKLDYLVFSSHKSGTQTMMHSLVCAGYKCRHCHLLENIDLKEGQFKSYINAYYQQNQKKLDVISVFRNPVERHISSFFQWYGSRPLIKREVHHVSETVIFQKSIHELQEQFINELKSNTLIGREESIFSICDELKINPQKLTFDGSKKIGVYEKKKIRLYLMRFDILFNDFEQILSKITDKPVGQVNKNMGSEKWYADKYLEFKKTLIIPEDIIYGVYKRRKILIDIFYPGKFDDLVHSAKEKYGIRVT